MAGNLNKYEVAQFKEAFALFDQNKDGVIEPSELKQMLAALGQECSDKEIKGLIDTRDELGTGVIDFPSFLKHFQHQEKEDPLEFFEEAYELIGGGGAIDASAIKQYLLKIGQNITDEEAQEILKLKDLDKDGNIGKEDFKAMWEQKEAEKIVAG